MWKLCRFDYTHASERSCAVLNTTSNWQAKEFWIECFFDNFCECLTSECFMILLSISLFPTNLRDQNAGSINNSNRLSLIGVNVKLV